MGEDVDWVEYWHALQAARARQAGSQRRDFWDRRAPGFALAPPHDQSAHFVTFLEPWIHPSKTLVDVGAGVGSLSAFLADRLRWVTAVEPSEGMRKHIPPRPNLTVIPSPWQRVEVGQADLVICAHVLYSVTDPVPFIEKLEAAAIERVFILLRDSPHTHPAQHLAARGKMQPPQLRDCFMLLRQIGIAPDLAMFTQPTYYYFASLDAAVDECRLSAGPGLDEQAARAWLAAKLQPKPDGTLVYEGGPMISGVLHWNPRPRAMGSCPAGEATRQQPNSNPPPTPVTSLPDSGGKARANTPP
jgi:Methyltransferase domain